MKKLFDVTAVVAACAVLALVSGCNTGKGTDKAGTKTLKVTVASSQSMTQGKTDDVDVSVTRSSGFDEPVTVTFENLPAGITVQNSDKVIAKGESKATYTLKAADDAKAENDHEVKVKAKSADVTADTSFKLTVKAK